ncbi:MAG TPA: type II CAAX endopeptidase family protein [Pseudolabrys sp.]|nr:type II CAAX endopeptidase family protein [Pseudolabrys sp.]
MASSDHSGNNPGLPISPNGAGQPRPIGFWLAAGWLSAAIIAASLFVFALLGSYELIFGSLPDEATVEQDLILCIYIVIVVALVETVRHAGWRVKDYLALVIPTRRQIVLGIALGAVLPFVTAAIAMLGPVAPDAPAYFEYNKISAAGVLPLFWLNAVFIGPAAEEVIFRGFLYRAWSATRLGPSGAIALTAIVFGLGHLEYGWFGMAGIAVSGLIMGWLRWRSGSLVPSMLTHGVYNACAMIALALAD